MKAEPLNEHLVSVIQGLISRELACAAADIGPQTRLGADLGADSLTIIQIVLDIEDVLDVDIENFRDGDDVTLEQLVRAIPIRKDRYRLDPDMPAQTMRLHMGELSAQEMRTARAVLRWANTVADRGAAPQDAALTRHGGRQAG